MPSTRQLHQFLCSCPFELKCMSTERTFISLYCIKKNRFQPASVHASRTSNINTTELHYSLYSRYIYFLNLCGFTHLSVTRMILFIDQFQYAKKKKKPAFVITALWSHSCVFIYDISNRPFFFSWRLAYARCTGKFNSDSMMAHGLTWCEASCALFKEQSTMIPSCVLINNSLWNKNYSCKQVLIVLLLGVLDDIFIVSHS